MEKNKKTCSTSRLSQKVYERDFYCHVCANPVRFIYERVDLQNCISVWICKNVATKISHIPSD